MSCSSEALKQSLWRTPFYIQYTFLWKKFSLHNAEIPWLQLFKPDAFLPVQYCSLLSTCTPSAFTTFSMLEINYCCTWHDELLWTCWAGMLPTSRKLLELWMDLTWAQSSNFTGSLCFLFFKLFSWFPSSLTYHFRFFFLPLFSVFPLVFVV